MGKTLGTKLNFAIKVYLFVIIFKQEGHISWCTVVYYSKSRLVAVVNGSIYYSKSCLVAVMNGIIYYSKSRLVAVVNGSIYYSKFRLIAVVNGSIL